MRAAAADHRPFLALLAAALLVRCVLFAIEPSGQLHFLDTGRYLTVAPFDDVREPSGYHIFARALHVVASSVPLLVAVQQILGLLTGIALYAAGRLAGLRRWPAALATVPVLFCGEALLFEQAPMAEALTAFWLAVALALLAAFAVRSSPALAFSAGLALGATATIRTVALPIAVFAILWVALVARGGVSRRALAALVATAGVAVTLGGYLIVATSGPHNGLGELSGTYAYARAAPFADCDEFDPPAGTAGLCETIPASQRPGPRFYALDPASPQFRVFPEAEGDPGFGGEALGAWAHRAMLAQPGDYASAVFRDLTRYVSEVRPPQAGAGDNFGPIILGETYPEPETAVRDVIRSRYPGVSGTPAGVNRTLQIYGDVTRLSGGLLAIVLILALVGAVLRSPTRRSAWLWMGVVLILAVVPIATLIFNQRYLIPAYGALGLAAAAGVQAARDAHRRRAAGRVAAAPYDAPASR